jgi:hypothetical protein
VRFAEHDEQVALFRMASYRKFGDGTVRSHMFAIPNGGTTGGKRAMLAAVRRKAEGLTSGVPDIFVFARNFDPLHRGLFIEMKRADGVPSDVSTTQKDMMECLSECGYECFVAFGADKAWNKICEFLGIKP